jgi:hypothetical protein
MFVGGYFLRILGCFILFLFNLILSILLRKRIIPFKEIWSAPYRTDVFLSKVSSELFQKLVGFFFIIFLILLVHFFPSIYY